MTVAFFDLDRTLIDVNSGTLWLAEEWQVGTIGWRAAALGAYWLGRYALGHTELVRAFDQAAAVYAGEDAQDVQARVEAWFGREVQPRLRPGALETLQAHRHAGHTLVLATSGSQFAAQAAQHAYGLDDAVSTRLEVVDGRLTGRVEQLAFGPYKLEACRRWAETHGASLDDATFYSDSYSDVSLLEAVGTPVVVDPDRRLRREAAARGWPVHDWGTAVP